jgi:bifunctional non-homologous end joining protein LigD
VLGGYVPKGGVLDSILVGYFEGDLMYAARVRAGLPGEFRRVLLPYFEELQIARCPFRNLPERTEGRWGEGLTAAKMGLCRWLDPFIVTGSSFWNGRRRADCVIRDSLESAATRTRARYAENEV